jgi:hypothetical protein
MNYCFDYGYGALYLFCLIEYDTVFSDIKGTTKFAARITEDAYTSDGTTSYRFDPAEYHNEAT